MLAQRKVGFLNRFYLIEVIRGLWITIKNFLFHEKVTLQFPEQRRDYSFRYRGQHYIKAVNGVENLSVT